MEHREDTRLEIGSTGNDPSILDKVFYLVTSCFACSMPQFPQLEKCRIMFSQFPLKGLLRDQIDGMAEKYNIQNGHLIMFMSLRRAYLHPEKIISIL